MTQTQDHNREPAPPDQEQNSWVRRVYNWAVRNADSPRALWILGFISFTESFFSPITPDVLLVPMSVASPKRLWIYCHVCIVTSVIGGIGGYLIGLLFYEHLGAAMIEFYGMSQAAEELRESYNSKYGFWVLVTKGVTPIPFKIVAIISGLTAFPFKLFLIGSIIARTSRFYIIAVLLYFYGNSVRKLIERYLGAAALLIIVFTILAVVLIPYYF